LHASHDANSPHDSEDPFAFHADPSRRLPPSPFFRWAMLVFVSLAMFGNYYVYDCIEPITDLLSKQLGFSDSNIGLLQAIYSFPNIIHGAGGRLPG
jgi:hypothetical protein